jgi:hypothetical protein
MQWCTTTLVLAGKPVALDELPVLDNLKRSKSQPLLVIASPETTLWKRILAERYLGFVKQWTLMFVPSVVTFGSPYCVMRLLKSLEDNHGRTDGAWVWLIGIGASSICQTIINYHLMWVQWSEMGIPVRAQLIMAIFQKAVRMKDSKTKRRILRRLRSQKLSTSSHQTHSPSANSLPSTTSFPRHSSGSSSPHYFS